MTKQEKAALETLTAEERYAASFNRARLDVDRKWLRILLRLAKRAAAQDSAVQRAERAVVQWVMGWRTGGWHEKDIGGLTARAARLKAARAKAKKARAK